LVGHSAGAQLIAMALSSIAARFEKAILVSGIFDLEPITKTSINNTTRLDPESSYRLSPINFVSKAKDTPLVIIWGENETDEFKRQSRDFESAWNKTDEHKPCVTREISKRNHFDILFDLTTPIVTDLFNE
jgi:arylformamidase